MSEPGSVTRASYGTTAACRAARTRAAGPAALLDGKEGHVRENRADHLLVTTG